jgi:hypothetical protein
MDTYSEQVPQLPPKTPIRTPVMGTKTIHRRTLSNSSSQFMNRNFSSHYNNEPKAEEMDLRFNNFNIVDAGDRQQFHSVPYNYNYTDISNMHQIPNRMRLYENVSHYHHHLQSSSLPQTPIKSTSKTEMNNVKEQIKSPLSFTNAQMRKMFFNPENTEPHLKPIPGNCDQILVNEGNISIVNAAKISGSTGCTPTHSTPQDSFSDDSSYLSALSRVRFSPDNFLNENSTFSPTSRMAMASMQRALVRRTIEIEENEKS